ncbi:choice-of-anchor tandem repeat GloVer-containing protein [Candidatus Auribacterota bacterium]
MKAIKIFIMLLVIAFISVSAYAVDIDILHSFSNDTDNGKSPRFSDLVLSGSSLYGTTQYGGANNKGTIFSVGVDGNGFVLLHSFALDNSEGNDLQGGLVLSGDTLFGMSRLGGANSRGTIYSVDTSGNNFSVLRSFVGNPTGSENPWGGMIVSGTTLIGMTYSGGSVDDGTVFSIGTDGNGYALLHSLNDASGEGINPYGELLLDGDRFYGMASDENLGGPGKVFSIGTDGTGYSELHAFAGGSADGDYPTGSLILSGGLLYGMATGLTGGTSGVIFQVEANGDNYTVMHIFEGGAVDGSTPYGDLTLVDSVLYGMTNLGGASNEGTVFSIAVDGQDFTLLHSFEGNPADGENPMGSLTYSAGDETFYGMTYQGGANDVGAVFSFSMGAEVPEPSTLLLLIPLLGGLYWMRKRREK